MTTNTYLSRYDGLTSEATFVCNGIEFGPIKMAIPEYHKMNSALSAARQEGAKAASTAMKIHIDRALQEMLSRSFYAF